VKGFIDAAREKHKETAMLSHPSPAESAPRVFDVTRRYVRVRERREDGFVEFDFSIGDPGLSVELVMSVPDYESFCAAHHAVHLSDDESAALDLEQLKWRYGEPGLAG
jgi:phenol/toluene 2-monooxygenase (NADH) P0/A0